LEKKKKKKIPSGNSTGSTLPDVSLDGLAQSQPEKKEKKKRPTENDMDLIAEKKMRRKSAPSMDAINNTKSNSTRQKASRSVSDKRTAKITKSRTTKQESDHT